MRSRLALLVDNTQVRALLLALAYLMALLASTNLGYARDEGFYFQAAEVYAQWFELLFRDPAVALSQKGVDPYWRVNCEHPALIKSLFALSYWLLHERLGVFVEPGTAYRFVGMLFGAMSVGVIYSWGARTLGPLAALTAAGLFIGLPRVFYHAHLACFDVPVLSLWLVVTYAYVWARSSSSWGRAALVGLLYGLLLNTKHNAWILPPVLLVEWLLPLALRRGLRREPQAWRPPRALIAMLVLGPLVLLLTWPWLWFDTIPRLRAWAQFHLQHVYYNMEFLGETYWKPPMPRLYAPLMTLATVPLVTLALFGLGAYQGLSTWLAAVLRKPEADPAVPEYSDSVLLWCLCIAGSYAPWLSPETPIFGGTKHWMTAYPYLCLVAGIGVRHLWAAVRVLATASAGRVLGLTALGRQLVAGAMLVASVVTGPLVMTAHAHPFGLSAYTPVVGGSVGAATLGLNRTFWGYTTSAVQDALNREAPPDARIYVHDTAVQSFLMMQRDGRLRRDLVPTLSISGSDLALYHHEPHMGRVEYQIWVDYGTTTPLAIGVHDGVPIVWLYKRPLGPR